MGNTIQAIANSGLFNVGVTPSYPAPHAYATKKLNSLTPLAADAYTKSNTALNNAKIKPATKSKQRGTVAQVVDAVGVFAVGGAIIKYAERKLK